MTIRTLTLCAVLLTACSSPSHDNVEKWRNTEEGPKHLTKAREDTSLDIEVPTTAGEKIIRAIGIKAGPKMVQVGEDMLKNADQGKKGILPISKTTLEGIAFTGAPEAVLFLLEVADKPQLQEGLQVQAMTALYTA